MAATPAAYYTTLETRARDPSAATPSLAALAATVRTCESPGEASCAKALLRPFFLFSALPCFWFYEQVLGISVAFGFVVGAPVPPIAGPPIAYTALRNVGGFV